MALIASSRRRPIGFFLAVLALSSVVFLVAGAPYAGLCFCAFTVFGTIVFPTHV